jgi:hypothetical protein
MKVTANPFARAAGCHPSASFVPPELIRTAFVEVPAFEKTSRSNRSSDEHRKVQFGEIDDHHARESMESPFRKSSSAVFPASMAARWERKPPSHMRTPMGFRLRRISQHQDSLPVPFRKIVT